MSRRQPRWSYIVAVMVAAPLLTACGGGDDPPDDGAAAEESSTTAEQTTTTLDTYGEVRAAFDGFAEMLVRLAQAPDPDDPEIAQRASGTTLTDVVRNMTTMQTIGERVEYGDRRATHVLSVTMQGPDGAIVAECTIDHRTVFTPTETVGPLVETYWTDWTLVRTNDIWMVDDSTPIRWLEGEQPCE